MRASAFLLILTMGHYGYQLWPYQWGAWATMQGVIGATLCWLVRRGRGMAWYVVSSLGFVLQSMVAVCQGANLFVPGYPGRGEQMCDVQTGLPLTAIGMIVVAGIALWLSEGQTA